MLVLKLKQNSYRIPLSETHVALQYYFFQGSQIETGKLDVWHSCQFLRGDTRFAQCRGRRSYQNKPRLPIKNYCFMIP